MQALYALSRGRSPKAQVGDVILQSGTGEPFPGAFDAIFHFNPNSLPFLLLVTPSGPTAGPRARYDPGGRRYVVASRLSSRVARSPLLYDPGGRESSVAAQRLPVKHQAGVIKGARHHAL